MEKAVKSANKEAEQIIEWGKSQGIETCFDRAEKLKPRPIGETGACCKVVHKGPWQACRKNAEEEAKEFRSKSCKLLQQGILSG